MMRTRPAFETGQLDGALLLIGCRLFDKDAARQHANDCFAALFSSDGPGDLSLGSICVLPCH